MKFCNSSARNGNSLQETFSPFVCVNDLLCFAFTIRHFKSFYGCLCTLIPALLLTVKAISVSSVWASGVHQGQHNNHKARKFCPDYLNK
jgi:hypothetical protein